MVFSKRSSRDIPARALAVPLGVVDVLSARSRAALAEAEQSVTQLKAAADGAQARADEEVASRDRTKQSFVRYQSGLVLNLRVLQAIHGSHIHLRRDAIPFRRSAPSSPRQRQLTGTCRGVKVGRAGAGLEKALGQWRSARCFSTIGTS